MPQTILTFAFYTLFFFTPLLFTPFTSELFEYNKMMFVYALTTIISLFWLIKMINTRSFIFKKTPLDLPLLLFLLSQLFSTIFSIDQHTSVWGYYSRANGGLLSIVSYIVLYYALVANFEREDVFKFLKAALWGGFLVALWAIPEHFGVSPSCILLTGQATADCWVQDVRARVFATLGQPNWLAAYLGMLIFPALYFLLTSTTRLTRFLYYPLLATYYLAFTFTYSRGATLGLLTGLAIFILIYLARYKNKQLKLLGLILGTFLIINLLFASALTSFKLIRQAAPAPRPAITTNTIPAGTQLENGGTESGQIRLIVWKGALEIFKHYPIFGSGVETFAYAYYNFRPTEHNFVSEWDFLYNKAHNEYLNYLANTGVVGFLSYLLLIGAFIYWCIKQKTHDTHYLILTTSLLASYISYLVQNFFGFSVVIVALFFYLFPALAFITNNSTQAAVLPKAISNLISSTFGKRKIYSQLGTVILLITLVILLSSISRLWTADTLFKKGSDYSDAGNPGRAYNYLVEAVNLNQGEPLYRAELGFAAASAAYALLEEDATTSAIIKVEALTQTKQALGTSPQNLSLWKTAVRTYYQLSALDPIYNDRTIEAINQSIKLAPTDPKLHYHKGLILSQLNRFKEAKEPLEEAVNLKPNYREAHFTLGVVLEQLGDKKGAIKHTQDLLQLLPQDADALKRLEELSKGTK